MVQGSDYRIKKVEKGPLQRFKNQNLLIKKFGEIGLHIYKSITGKRTTKELKQDLGVDPQVFDQVINYMQDAGMIELEPSGEGAPPAKELPREKPAEEEKPVEEPTEEEPTLEELPAEEEEEVIPLEEEPQEEITFEEIKPIEFEDEEKPVEEKPEEEPEEEEPEEEKPAEPPEEEITMVHEEEPEEKSNLSPVEKIISNKYGDLGLQVYSLIDGQRTAEEIMSETGLTEAKLVEMLDFMDEQGIIKLDYPKGKKGRGPPPPRGPPPRGYATRGPAPPPASARKATGFVPMIEGEESLEEARAVPSPLEIPVKAPLDIVKSVQMKAKVMLKLGDKGNKLLELIDGKNDTIDIALKLNIPLYTVFSMLHFLLENGMIIMKALSRSDVHKKYGDDGYSVYKRYGKEGLMLYELIGKDLTIKQMADKITQDRSQIIDMFIFIHQVLGIELPIDRDILAKQLEL
ncbi:hypothetical protein KKB44_06320 [Candidatus Micrarchaeota archaeon]|nr:hypothetical protein [Candidatus Micrarchaeota archaeon]